MLGPAIEGEAAKRAGKIELVKIDVDAEQALAAQYGVQSIPTVAVFRDGAPVTGFVGPTRRARSPASSTKRSRSMGRRSRLHETHVIAVSRPSSLVPQKRRAQSAT